jgi:hypothetical protein
MQKPRFADTTIVFSEHEVFKVVVMVTRDIVRIFLQMKSPLKISLLITKFLISQTYMFVGTLLHAEIICCLFSFKIYATLIF